MNISVTGPIDQAAERTKQILFQPFKAGKWFKLGFCAWLAELGETGCQGNFPGGGGGGRGTGGGGGGGAPTVTGIQEQVTDWIKTNWTWLAPAIAIGVVVLIGLMVLLTWVRSRGKFMLIDGIVRNRGEV